jgi:hypothetical protein
MTTNTEPLKVGEECREAFQQWATAKGYKLSKMHDHEYESMQTCAAWDCWRAAWNRRTEPSPAEVGSEGLVDFAIEIFDMSKDGGADLTSVREYAERFAESRLSQQSPARVEGGE